MNKYISKNKKIIYIVASMLINSLFTVNSFAQNNSSKVHFLPVGGGDAILIESNGKFALVDGGEDSDNPRRLPDLEHHGYEKQVVNYIKKVAGDKNGNVTLEWIVGTHAHSDHLGGLDTVINDPKILVKKGYIKKYDPSKITDYEVKNWDNQEVYNQTIKALKSEKATIVSNIPKNSFKLGDLDIQFFNTEYDTSNIKKGENENSLGIKVSKNNKSIFLAGDINNKDGDENKLVKQLGKIDILKLGHHGLLGSTENLNATGYSIAILTNYEEGLYDTTRSKINENNATVYSTMRNNGVIATFGEENFGLNKYFPLETYWVQVGHDWYYKLNGERVSGWKKVLWEDKLGWYYFDEQLDTHYMKTGWLNKDDKWYYLNTETNNKGPKGIMLTGWQDLDWNNKKEWFYFNKSGEMHTGWLENNNQWYYLREKEDKNGTTGSMVTGWQQIKWDNKIDWYYFAENGAMKTGWLKQNNNWYYLKDNTDSKGYKGSMLTGKHYLSSNGKKAWYTFDNQGRLK